MILEVARTVLVIILSSYVFISTMMTIESADIANDYHENYCLAEYQISKANPSDPVVLELQRIAKENKFCDGFDVSDY